jgi:hypothetical protein
MLIEYDCITGGRGMSARLRVGLWVGLLTALPGCAGNADPPRSPTEERLYQLGTAYTQATHNLDRAPKNFDEIKPHLKGVDADTVLRSENDGEPFVILWGVDYLKLPPGKGDPFTVAAYEKHGKNGTRYVLRFPLSVVALTDDEFQRAVFPPGHEPPR